MFGSTLREWGINYVLLVLTIPLYLRFSYVLWKYRVRDFAVLTLLFVVFLVVAFIGDLDRFVEFYNCFTQGPACLRQTECRITGVKTKMVEGSETWRITCLKPDETTEVMEIRDAEFAKRARDAMAAQWPVCMRHFPVSKLIVEMTEGRCE